MVDEGSVQPEPAPVQVDSTSSQTRTNSRSEAPLLVDAARIPKRLAVGPRSS
jgi:hypothetical protein